MTDNIEQFKQEKKKMTGEKRVDDCHGNSYLNILTIILIHRIFNG